MGKGDLWDDSVLITAFDRAISKYKVMHGINGSNDEKGGNSNILDSGSNEHVQSEDNIDAALDTKEEIVETVDYLHVLENLTLESDSSAKDINLSHTQNGSAPTIKENAADELGQPGQHTASSDVKSQNQWYSDGWEEYSQLYNKYYEIEDQRQKILQQLNQYSNWNYQNPVCNTSITEEHQGSVAPPYDTATCCCPYGCQNWVVPCNSLPASCSGGTCTDKDCTAIPKDVQDGNSISEKDPDIVKMAMATAEMALSSLTKEASNNANISANGGKVSGKEKELGKERGHFTESTNSATDLSAVLNAWYSAGFYTGKYLSEQSLEMRKHG